MGYYLYPAFCLCSVIYVLCRVWLFYEGEYLAPGGSGEWVVRMLTRWARYLYVTFGGCCARGGRRDNGVGAVHCILSVVDVYWSKCPFVLIVEMESYDVISVFVR